MRRVKGGVAASLALAAALLAGCDAAPAQIERDEVPLPGVRVEAVRLSQDEVRHRFPGTVRASARAAPAFLHGGVLQERLVTRGQRVEKGEPLATLHNPAMAPALAAAEARVRELDASLSRLGRDVERARTLRERNLSTEEELDRLRAEREATAQARERAVAQRDEARAQLDELTLRAPFAAEVTDLEVEPGDFVAAGQPVLKLAGLDGREVELRVPGRLAARLETGQEAALTSRSGAQRLAGRVAHVGRADDSMAPIIVTIESEPTPALGESLHVQLVLAADPLMQVPLAAVVDPGGHAPHVLMLDADESVRHVAVTPGRLADGWVSVSAEGLAPGDRVVTAGQGRLEESAQVRVLP
ncbi:efflux RND transporter periplasmic adaptor subunit [Halomonas sp. MCCC 1A17488]|uniref:Efflux RND transporter periplasmic adaptor subunit n=1 Tax=Billgrantia sulfidoxydans TaxID=2733484 RepID=A0ABX7W1Y2_9GAMM|nr:MULTISPECIES: efflux RND transporter periplasmic adaptor subunit [Halomonas]MCE8015838.1 efflux RND transporter periplasmic adaptor subunit [Halomonas sp. MCCC 1A17488]MCG3239171.1 efflux RND transporter periplasmic adaptor subunit [Halomonas sp. MCCC 1A17488]QPP50889.1 efflux RND transporter periplasmic adaptor subunit [Halomonas sp. SS10-MC5]QTP54414.1 efflux RND transporter periplasmic adaptor subunit [Halomonas sulfidoxydans]